MSDPIRTPLAAKTAVPATRPWFTPPEVAKTRGIRVAKVHAWIRSGELAAVNHATNPRGSPRWRISNEALAAFDRARSNHHATPPASRRTARDRFRGVEEYF